MFVKWTYVIHSTAVFFVTFSDTSLRVGCIQTSRANWRLSWTSRHWCCKTLFINNVQRTLETLIQLQFSMLRNYIVSYRNGVLEVPRGELTIGLGFSTMVLASASDLESLAVKCACVRWNSTWILLFCSSLRVQTKNKFQILCQSLILHLCIKKKSFALTRSKGIGLQSNIHHISTKNLWEIHRIPMLI